MFAGFSVVFYGSDSRSYLVKTLKDIVEMSKILYSGNFIITHAVI